MLVQCTIANIRGVLRYNKTMRTYGNILQSSHEVLDRVDCGAYTIPNTDIFGKSQFLWDSCLVAEGLAYTNVDRAQQEILSLLDGQHDDGMIANETVRDARCMQRLVFGTIPNDEGIVTSGITQPPVIATSALEVGRKLDEDQRRQFFGKIFKPLERYHTWLFKARVLDNTGLVTLIHPYESGMDTLPPWREAMHDYWLGSGGWKRLAASLGEAAVGLGRKHFADTKHVPIAQRADNRDVLTSYMQTKAIAKHGYNLLSILRNSSLPLQQDVGFNSLFAEANQSLLEIEDELNSPAYALKPSTKKSIDTHRQAIVDHLAAINVNTGSIRFFNRDARSGELIDIDTVGGLLPLCADIPKEHSDDLVKHLTNPDTYWSTCPIPSVAMDDPHFHDTAYWRGASWPFPRFFLERALIRINKAEEARELRRKVLGRRGEEVKSEYDHAQTGIPMGISQFGPAAGADIVFTQKERTSRAKTRYTTPHE